MKNNNKNNKIKFNKKIFNNNNNNNKNKNNKMTKKTEGKRSRRLERREATTPGEVQAAQPATTSLKTP